MKKEESKISIIKRYIALDPDNPGVVSRQRFTTSSGKKTKYYYLWQSSILGKKRSVRIPRSDVGAVKKVVNAAAEKAERNDNRTISALKTVDQARERIKMYNRSVRSTNRDAASRERRDDRSRKDEIKRLERLVRKRTKKAGSGKPKWRKG